MGLLDIGDVAFWPADVSEDDDYVCISFDIAEENRTRRWQISSALLCRAENLIDGSTIVSTDDD